MLELHSCEGYVSSVHHSIGDYRAVHLLANAAEQLFTGGEALDFSISDSTFTSNRAVLGSSIATSSTVVLKDGSSIDSCSFKQEQSTLGALSFAHLSGTLFIQNSLFDNCYGSRIAVLNLQTGDEAMTYMTEVTVQNSIGAPVIHKTNAMLVSVLITQKCSFLHNEMTSIRLENGIWQDSGSQFLYNQETAVESRADSSAILTNTAFESNTGISFTAAYYGSHSTLECTNCTFRNNSAEYASAIAVEQLSIATLRNCIFERNTATIFASVLLAIGTYPIYIFHSIFRFNTSPDSLFSLFNANIYLESVLVESNTASDGDPSVSMSQSVLSINNVTFRDQIGAEVAFLYIESDSNVTIRNSHFYAGSGYSSGAITLASSAILIINSTFSELKGTESAILWTEGSNIIVFDLVDGINLYSDLSGSVVFAVSSQLSFTNCKFEDFALEAVLGIGLKSLFIGNSTFRFGRGWDGAGVQCDRCEKVEIEGSRFEALNASYDGGAVVLYGCSDVTISSTVFKANRAETGGGVYAKDSILLISESAFYENTANGTEGGGLYVDCPGLENCGYKVVNTVFEGNTAYVSGGALAWKQAKPDLINVTTANNSAYYGPDFASFPTHLEIRSSRLLQELTDLPPGQPAKVTIIAALVDHYDQIVLTDNSSTASLVAIGSTASVSGASVITAINGIFTFYDFSVFAPPMRSVILTIVATGVPETSIFDPTLYNKSVEISVSMRGCVPGESATAESCTLCGKGTYGFDPAQPCQNCPANVQCLGTTYMYPNPGYWRSGVYDEIIWLCPRPNSCLGGDPFDNHSISWTGYCTEGYTDNMCESCDLGYSRAGKDKCGKCPPLDVNIVRLVFVVIAMVAYNTYQVWAALKNATKPTAIHSIYLKILTNYLQLVFLVTEFRLSWPQPVLDLFAAQESSGGVTE